MVAIAPPVQRVEEEEEEEGGRAGEWALPWPYCCGAKPGDGEGERDARAAGVGARGRVTASGDQHAAAPTVVVRRRQRGREAPCRRRPPREAGRVASPDLERGREMGMEEVDIFGVYSKSLGR